MTTIPELERLAKPVEYGHAPATCAVTGCERSHRAMHLCAAHYVKLQRDRHARGLGRIPRIPAKPSPALWRRDHPDTCTVIGCSKPYNSRGLCKAHYEHARRNGVTQNGTQS